LDEQSPGKPGETVMVSRYRLKQKRGGIGIRSQHDRLETRFHYIQELEKENHIRTGKLPGFAKAFVIAFSIEQAIPQQDPESQEQMGQKRLVGLGLGGQPMSNGVQTRKRAVTDMTGERGRISGSIVGKESDVIGKQDGRALGERVLQTGSENEILP
jgi:hypothetical protein